MATYQNTWADFLEKTDDFYSDRVDTDEGYDTVLWNTTTSRGLGIKSYVNGKSTTISHPKLERAYNALKEVDESVRYEIYDKLVIGDIPF